MPSLTDIAASVPFLGAYRQREAQIQGQDMQQLQQASVLAQLAGHMQAQEKDRQAQARREQYRAEIAALGPNATQEQLAGIAAKFTDDPGKLLDVQQRSLDRQDATAARSEAAGARSDASKEALAARVEAQKANATMLHEFRMSRLQTDADRAAETARHNRVLEGLTASLRATQAQGGKPPSGYRTTADGNLEAIPGGPADLKLQGQFNQDTSTLNTTTANMDRLATAANEVMNHPGLEGITGLRGAIPNIPGSAAANAQAKLDTLKAQVGFGVLQELRNASKTGGALGQITEKEHVLLQNALAALQNSQDANQMRESLQKVIEYTSGAKERLRNAYNMKHSDKPNAAPTTGGWAVVK